MSLEEEYYIGFMNPHRRDKEGRTVLMHASQNGRTKMALILIENGAGLNEQDENGLTALMHASQNGHTETALMLIEKGADLNKQDKEGRTALSITIAKELDSVTSMIRETLFSE